MASVEWDIRGSNMSMEMVDSFCIAPQICYKRSMSVSTWAANPRVSQPGFSLH